jgi:hypothetical protein
MKQLNEIKRMQQLAGLITESQLSEAEENEAVNYTIKILSNFKRSKPFDAATILRKAESLKSYIDNQYDTEEIGAEMAYTEVDDLIDALKRGDNVLYAVDSAINNLTGDTYTGEENDNIDFNPDELEWEEDEKNIATFLNNHQDEVFNKIIMPVIETEIHIDRHFNNGELTNNPKSKQLISIVKNEYLNKWEMSDEEFEDNLDDFQMAELIIYINPPVPPNIGSADVAMGFNASFSSEWPEDTLEMDTEPITIGGKTIYYGRWDDLV